MKRRLLSNRARLLAPIRIRPTSRTLSRAILAAWILAASASIAGAQIATLDKGHQLLVNNGLQIWGLDQCGGCTFNYNGLANANFNGVLWSWNVDNAPHPRLNTLTSGQKWGKWADPNIAPASTLDATESSKISDLIALQIGDEQQSDLENPNGVSSAWLQVAHAGNYFTNQLLYVNSFYVGSDANYASFISTANPDAISFDSYPFDVPYGTIIYPNNWLAKAGQFRRHALSSYIGTGSNSPRPYGMYLQTYEAPDEQSAGHGTRHPGDVEMRWQQFTAWTMGFTFVDAFTVSGSGSLFTDGNMNSPTQPRYSQFAETARQGKNLGPALTHLISYGYGPSIVTGKDAAGTPNPVPSDWLGFNKANAPPNQQYLSSVSATNIGTKNNGQPGDVYIGFFNPLLTSYGDPAGTAYFMVTNALGPYLDDPSATVAQCMQQITLNFDFGASGINSLQRLSRDTGQVEVVPLTHGSGSLYSLMFNLEGGTGDLFKYNDGTPFVGVQLPIITAYWDNDATAGNNNLTTGAGLGGSGSWDSSASKWFNGSSNGTWAANNNAVFWGTAGTVTLAGPQSVSSLTFKTNGYTVSGSTLTMTGPNITVDPLATATITSAIAGSIGLAKNGAGTLILAASNSYTGGTTVSAGALQVSSDGNLGAAPGSFTAGNITLDGGTLRFGGNFDLSNNRGITLGIGGGTIDTQTFANASGYTQADGIQGTGNLTKIGTGTFYMNTPAGVLNNNWKGNLVLKQGTWKITERGGLPYNANNDSVYRPSQITFDGGTLQIAASISTSSNYRGITITSGGTFDTQSFNFTWGGPVIGSVASATFTKIGSGQLQFNTATAAGTGPGTYSGNLAINDGTVALNGGGAWGDLSAISVANAAGARLTISNGTETIGSLSGGGSSGGSVILFSSVVTGGNNSSTTFSGIISSTGGVGGLTKNGSGVFTLAPWSGGNVYTGTTTINAGTLMVNNTSGSGTGTGAVIVNSSATLGGTGAVSGPVTINSGGHIAPGASIESLDVGSITLAAGSILDFELGTILGVDTSDLLNVTTTNGLTINGGTLNLTNAAGMTGGFYTLIDYAGSLNGSFGNLALGAMPAGFTYSLFNDTVSKTIQLEVTAPGDFNHDGTVDGADYVVWRKGLNTKYTPADYDSWRGHFGQTYMPSSGTELSAVPEPGAWVLFLVCTVLALAGCRWRISLSPTLG